MGSITVIDAGPGIAPQELPHIFGRFYRGRQTSRTAAASGLGLGLAIAKRIAELHGGQIAASNSPTTGAVCDVRLPADRKTFE